MASRSAKLPDRRGSTPRFELEGLSALVGPPVFARGEAYYRKDAVQLLSVDAERVLARVLGSETYRVEIGGRGSRLRLACSCPAFRDHGPCKHIVATALAANARRGDEPDELSRIRAYLGTRSVEDLTALLVARAEEDQELFRKLDLAATTAGGDCAVVLERLRRALDEATDRRRFAYEGAGVIADEFGQVIDAIAAFDVPAHADARLALADRAIARLVEVLDHVDDSDGECSSLLVEARDLHLAATIAARPDPTRLAHDLFEREMGDHYGLFEGAANLYAEALGDTGRRVYRRLAEAAWAKPTTGEQGVDARTDRLASVLDEFAARDGDLERRIALRTRDLSSPFRYLALAEFCKRHGRPEDALERAEEGLWMFEDGRPDLRLVLFTVDLLRERTRDRDAAALLRRVFDKTPRIEFYERVRPSDEGVRDQMIESLEAKLAAGAERHTGGDLLARILLRDKRFDLAWRAVERYGASDATKDALAVESKTTHPAESLAHYAARVDALIVSGHSRDYEKAVAFVNDMASLRDAGAQNAYVAELRTRFGRKRNFMKLLDAADAGSSRMK